MDDNQLNIRHRRLHLVLNDDHVRFTNNRGAARNLYKQNLYRQLHGIDSVCASALAEALIIQRLAKNQIVHLGSSNSQLKIIRSCFESHGRQSFARKYARVYGIARYDEFLQHDQRFMELHQEFDVMLALADGNVNQAIIHHTNIDNLIRHAFGAYILVLAAIPRNNDNILPENYSMDDLNRYNELSSRIYRQMKIINECLWALMRPSDSLRRHIEVLDNYIARAVEIELKLQRMRQQATVGAEVTRASEMNPESLAVLLPAIWEEVFAQQLLEQERHTVIPTNSADLVDAAAFFQNLQPSFQQKILADTVTPVEGS